MRLGKRLRFTFWLDMHKADENQLAEWIDSLKEKRLFSQTIRDGIRLILDLRKGRTEVLRELFPWVLEQSDSKPNYDQLTADELKQHLARLERLLLDHKPADAPPMLPAPRPAKPADDGIELEIKAATSDENPTFNLMISMMGLTGKWEDLPSEVLEYGLKKGRVPAHVQTLLKSRAASAKPSEPKALPSGAGGPKAMDVPQFAGPDFDDLDWDTG